MGDSMPSLKKRSHKGYERVATDDLDDIAESYGPEDVPVPKVLHDFDPNVRPALSPSPPPPRPPSLQRRARPANGGLSSVELTVLRPRWPSGCDAGIW